MTALYLFYFGLVFAVAAIVCFIVSKAFKRFGDKSDSAKTKKEKNVKRIETASISFFETNFSRKKEVSSTTYCFVMMDNDSDRRFVEFCNAYDFCSFGRGFINACCTLGTPKSVLMPEELKAYIKGSFKFSFRYKLMQFLMRFKTVVSSEDKCTALADEVRSILKTVASRDTVTMYSQASKMLCSERLDSISLGISFKRLKKMFFRHKKVQENPMVEFEGSEYEIPVSNVNVCIWVQEGFVYIFSENTKTCLAVYYQSAIGQSNMLVRALEKGPFPVVVTCKNGVEIIRKRK